MIIISDSSCDIWELQEEIVKLYPEVEVKLYPSRGLCAYYGERGGLLVGCEI